MKKELKDLLKKLGKRAVPTFPARVVSVEGQTCTVDEGDLELTDVQLRATVDDSDQVILITPKVGSWVLVAPIMEDINRLHVVEYSEVEKVEIRIGDCLVEVTKDGVKLHGDNLGGIVKARELKTQVDKNTKILEQIQTVFNSWQFVPEDGGAALKGLSSAFTGLPRADLSNIENDKVKHGE